MRITNKMITTKYTRSLSNLSYELDRLNTQVTSGRKFTTASENPSAAVKAFQIRRDLSRIDGFQDNISHAKSALTNAESALSHIEELIKEANDKILSGINGTKEIGDRTIIATELRNIQDQLLQTLNANASDVYYFGGSNTDTKPFSVDGSGNLIYNGMNLNSSTLNLDATDPMYDAAEVALRDSLIKDSMYVDIGLNVQFDVAGQVDRRTVFEYSTPGISIVGSGKTTVNGIEMPDNLYNLIGEIAKELESGAYSSGKTDQLLGHFQKANQNIIKSITDIGSKTSYLNFMTDRFDSQTLDMQERQMSVEGADPAETIIKFKSQQVAYNAALQMGTQIIQPSIFDFMR